MFVHVLLFNLRLYLFKLLVSSANLFLFDVKLFVVEFNLDLLVKVIVVVLPVVLHFQGNSLTSPRRFLDIL